MIPSASLVLLDTNVLIHLVRDSAVGRRILADYALRDRRQRPLISIITVGEMLALSMKLRWGDNKRAALRGLFGNLVVVHPSQGGVVERYAEIDHFCEHVMKPARKMGQNDMWIAATASVLGAHLLTTDSDFHHLDKQFIKLVHIDSDTGP